MVLKVAVEDRFQFKMVPSIKSLFTVSQPDVHYIGGSDVLPAPLEAEEEARIIEELSTENEGDAKKCLIEHNLRLVVYIAKRFESPKVLLKDLTIQALV